MTKTLNCTHVHVFVLILVLFFLNFDVPWLSKNNNNIMINLVCNLTPYVTLLLHIFKLPYVCACVQPSRIKRFILFICVDHSVPSLSHISEKRVSGAACIRTSNIQFQYYTLGKAEQQLAKCNFKN